MKQWILGSLSLPLSLWMKRTRLVQSLNHVPFSLSTFFFFFFSLRVPPHPNPRTRANPFWWSCFDKIDGRYLFIFSYSFSSDFEVNSKHSSEHTHSPWLDCLKVEAMNVQTTDGKFLTNKYERCQCTLYGCVYTTEGEDETEKSWLTVSNIDFTTKKNEEANKMNRYARALAVSSSHFRLQAKTIPFELHLSDSITMNPT